MQRQSIDTCDTQINTPSYITLPFFTSSFIQLSWRIPRSYYTSHNLKGRRGEYLLSSHYVYPQGQRLGLCLVHKPSANLSQSRWYSSSSRICDINAALNPLLATLFEVNPYSTHTHPTTHNVGPRAIPRWRGQPRRAAQD